MLPGEGQTYTIPGTNMIEAVELGNPDERFQEILNRLSAMSQRDYYNPYQLFQWPERLPESQFWMSPELMSVHGTELADELTEEQLWALSKWESVNFYSLNVHGIRELLTEVIRRIHTKGFEKPSEYFHHMIGEENDHMWFFATFCLKYGGKVYPDKQLRWNNAEYPEAAHFLVFARLLIFEEIVDFFNAKMAADDRLHPTIKQINAIHHQDESRHVAFGRQAVAHLHGQLRDALSAEKLAELEDYLKTYMRVSVESLCSPAVYRDADIPNPYRARRRVLADPAWCNYQRTALKRSTSFMVKAGIFRDEEIPAG